MDMFFSGTEEEMEKEFNSLFDGEVVLTYEPRLPVDMLTEDIVHDISVQESDHNIKRVNGQGLHVLEAIREIPVKEMVEFVESMTSHEDDKVITYSENFVKSEKLYNTYDTVGELDPHRSYEVIISGIKSIIHPSRAMVTVFHNVIGENVYTSSGMYKRGILGVEIDNLRTGDLVQVDTDYKVVHSIVQPFPNEPIRVDVPSIATPDLIRKMENYVLDPGKKKLPFFKPLDEGRYNPMVISLCRLRRRRYMPLREVVQGGCMRTMSLLILCGIVYSNYFHVNSFKRRCKEIRKKIHSGFSEEDKKIYKRVENMCFIKYQERSLSDIKLDQQLILAGPRRGNVGVPRGFIIL
jgi:hypothetical protein